MVVVHYFDLEEEQTGCGRPPEGLNTTKDMQGVNCDRCKVALETRRANEEG